MLNFWKFPTNSQQILKSTFIDAVTFTSVKTWKNLTTAIAKFQYIHICVHLSTAYLVERIYVFYSCVHTKCLNSLKNLEQTGTCELCRFSVLDGVHAVFWRESRIWTGTLVNFCRRKLSGETLCKVVQIFPPKDLVYFLKILLTLLLVYFSINITL